MPTKRELLSSALQNFIFSLSRGAAAQAQFPGARGARAGMAAALAAPMELQEMMRQRQVQDEERQMRVQQFQNQIRQGKINEAVQLLGLQQGRPAPQTPVQFGPQGETPIGAMPGQTQPAIPPMNATIRGQLPSIPSPLGPLQPQSAEELADVAAMEPTARLARERETRLAAQSKLGASTALAKAGYRPKTDADGNIIGLEPIPEEELSAPERQKIVDAKALTDLRESQIKLNQARAELAKVQADPNNPQYQLRKRALEIAEQNAQTAQERLGISAANLGIREKQFELGTIGQFSKVRPFLDSVYELSKKINTQEGVIAKISGEAEKLKAKANLSDDVAEYEAMILSFTPTWARAMGHTGTMTQLDVESARAALPKPGDSESLANRKMARIEKILSGIEEKTREIIDKPSTVPTKTPPKPASSGWSVKPKGGG